MYPQLEIYMDDATEPRTVQPLTVDFDLYEETIGAKKATDAGLRLFVAYIHIEGKEPRNMTEVRAWGREHRVQIMLGQAPDPTRSGPSGV